MRKLSHTRVAQTLEAYSKELMEASLSGDPDPHALALMANGLANLAENLRRPRGIIQQD